MKKVLLGLLGITMLVSCTENTRARVWGGSQTIQLEEGVRLVNVTWKEGSSLWILTKRDTTKASTYSFSEKSNLGVMEGHVIIIEK